MTEINFDSFTMYQERKSKEIYGEVRIFIKATRRLLLNTYYILKGSSIRVYDWEWVEVISPIAIHKKLMKEKND